MMNLRSLRIRLARLEEQFPQGDERSIADARLESLLWKERINGLNSLTRVERGEKYVLWCWLRNMPDKTLPEAIARLKKHLAEFNIPIDLSAFEAVEPITKAEREDVKAPSPPPKRRTSWPNSSARSTTPNLLPGVRRLQTTSRLWERPRKNTALSRTSGCDCDSWNGRRRQLPEQVPKMLQASVPRLQLQKRAIGCRGGLKRKHPLAGRGSLMTRMT